jgi:translation initiation factor IF-2
LNTDKTPGTKNAGQQVLTVAEVTALFAGRGGGAPGGGGAAPGGAPPAGGAAPGGAPPAGGGGGGAGFDPATIFAGWDTNMDGEVTSAEFDARPRRGGGGGRGAPGGAPPAAPAAPAQ